MAEHEHLAVARLELVEGLPHPLSQLLADQLPARARAVRHQPIYQQEARLVGQAGLVDRLAGDATAAGPQVMPMQLDQPLPGQPAQPG